MCVAAEEVTLSTQRACRQRPEHNNVSHPACICLECDMTSRTLLYVVEASVQLQCQSETNVLDSVGQIKPARIRVVVVVAVVCF